MITSASKIWVVGGASGVGKCTTARLLKKGYFVINSDCDSEKLNSLKSEFSEYIEKKLYLLPLDITDRSATKACISVIREKFAPLDSVVISAAIHSSYPAEYLTDKSIDQNIDVNLSAHIKLTRDTLPILKDGGRIIGISSIAAGLGVPMESMYSATKAGLEAFYESMATEISYRKIKPIVIHPGNINTGFNETGNDYSPTGNRFVDDGYKRVVSGIDSSKGMKPEAVSEVILKAIESSSPRFSYIVGMNALKAHWAKRLLGRDLALKLMAKFFGFSI